MTAGPVKRLVARSPTGLFEKPICRLGSADMRAVRAVVGGFFAAGGALASGAAAGFALTGALGVEPVTGISTGLAAATTIVIASGTGIPISTTHTLVGAVLGVGMARGIEAIDLRVVGRIFVSWVVTIPAGAILAVLFFFIFRQLLP